MKGHGQIAAFVFLYMCFFPCALSLVYISDATTRFALTSVALSAWSLMLIKACNSLSDPRLMGDSQGLSVLAHGPKVLLWLGWLFAGILLEH